LHSEVEGVISQLPFPNNQLPEKLRPMPNGNALKTENDIIFPEE